MIIWNFKRKIFTIIVMNINLSMLEEWDLRDPIRVDHVTVFCLIKICILQ